MPSRASKRKMPRDFNQIAAALVPKDDPDPAAEPDTRNQAAVALSKLGASKGGIARAKRLSKAERKKIAKKAATVRWKTRRQPKKS